MEEKSLDPERWSDFEATLHRVGSELVEFVRSIRSRDVWRRPPEEVKEFFASPPPEEGEDLGVIWDDVREHILPYLTGNLHPRFHGWAHGAGTPAGAVAEMVSGFLDANLAGRDQAPVYLERQVIDWCKDLLGFPTEASGTLVSGTSIGNLVGLTVARDASTDWFRKRERGTPEPRVYASAASHLSVRRALHLAGFPDRSTRLVDADDAQRLNPEVLRQQIAADRAEGHDPVAVVATVGTSGTGAIDPLPDIVELCGNHGLWLHVDGAFGALSFLSPDPPGNIAGLSEADSVAFDFHKWMHVPYSAGCVLVRNPRAHLRTYGVSAPYADTGSGELGGGRPWPTDFGPEMSKSFRALKTWVTIRHYGVDRLVRHIDRTRNLARHFAGWIRNNAELELWEPVDLNIVCCRFGKAPGDDGGEADRIQEKIVERLQASGRAAPSATRIDGRVFVRTAVFNHRTTREDLVDLGRDIVRAGQRLSRGDAVS